jgi:hypothetical protein
MPSVEITNSAEDGGERGWATLELGIGDIWEVGEEVGDASTVAEGVGTDAGNNGVGGEASRVGKDSGVCEVEGVEDG